MISIAGNLSDEYTKVGYQYFLTRYGFTQSVNNIIHIDRDNYPKDSCQDNFQGWVTWDGCKLPVLIPPAHLSQVGTILLNYSNNNELFPCAIVHDQDIIISLDIFRHIGLFLSGNLERTWKDLGHRKDSIVAIPFVDYYCDLVFTCLLEDQKAKRIPLIHKSFWPAGKRYAVCLTHDVDEIKKTYQWITYPIKLLLKGNLKGIVLQFRSFVQLLKGYEPYWTFDELIQLEDNLKVRSSFYFLQETAETSLTDRSTWRHMGRRYDLSADSMQRLLHALHMGGWDVGLHGSFNSFDDCQKLAEENHRLETILGHRVHGIRQHNLNLKIFKTWLCHEQSDIEYDTTLGFNNCIGFRWGISLPFRPYFQTEKRLLRVLEIPLAIEDLPYFNTPNRWDEFVEIERKIRHVQGMITLLWHHSVFNDREFFGWSAEYKKMIEYGQNNNAWIASGKQIQNWWSWRDSTRVESVFDGKKLIIFPFPEQLEHYITVFLPDSDSRFEIRNAEIILRHENTLLIKTDLLKPGKTVEIIFLEG